MSIKKTSPKGSPKPLTETFLVEQLQSLEKRFDGKFQLTRSFVVEQLQSLESKIEQTKTFLESKINYARKDASDQINTVSGGLLKKINELGEKMDVVELKIGALHDNIDFIKSDVREIKGKLNRHDEEIGFLKARVA